MMHLYSFQVLEYLKEKYWQNVNTQSSNNKDTFTLYKCHQTSIICFLFQGLKMLVMQKCLKITILHLMTFLQIIVCYGCIYWGQFSQSWQKRTNSITISLNKEYLVPHTECIPPRPGIHNTCWYLCCSSTFCLALLRSIRRKLRPHTPFGCFIRIHILPTLCIRKHILLYRLLLQTQQSWTSNLAKKNATYTYNLGSVYFQFSCFYYQFNYSSGSYSNSSVILLHHLVSRFMLITSSQRLK